MTPPLRRKERKKREKNTILAYIKEKKKNKARR